MFVFNTLSKTLSKTDAISTLTVKEKANKTHAHIMRDVRSICSELDIDPEEFVGSYTDSRGVSRNCYNLPRDLFDIVMSTYSIQYLASVVDQRNVL